MTQNECVSSQKHSFNILLDHAANVTWDTTLHGATDFSVSFSRIFFLSIGKKKDYIRCKGVQYIFILWLHLSLTRLLHHPPQCIHVHLRKETLDVQMLYQNKPSFVHKGDRDSERNMGFIIWCGVKNVLYVTNSPLNLTKTGHPFGNGLHHAWT